MDNAIGSDDVEGALGEARVGGFHLFETGVGNAAFAGLGAGYLDHVGRVVDAPDLPGERGEIEGDLAGRAAEVEDVVGVLDHRGRTLEAGGVVRSFGELGVVASGSLIPEFPGSRH